jgi:excisionase family DNA binding protein
MNFNEPRIDPGDGLLTPDEAAALLKVTAEQIRSLIRQGQLSAVNVGSGKKRPLYRITQQALQDFLSRRWQPGRAVRSRRAKPHPPVRDHFPNLR